MGLVFDGAKDAEQETSKTITYRVGNGYYSEAKASVPWESNKMGE